MAQKYIKNIPHEEVVALSALVNAEEGQVVTIETQGDDYVRQYAQMP